MFFNFMETKLSNENNQCNKNIVTMLNEANKPFYKMLSRNKLFIELKEAFGLERISGVGS